MHRATPGRTRRLLARGGAVGCGQRELDDRAALAGIDHVDGAAVQLDRELAESETEPGAAAAPARALIEPVKDVRSVVRIDARPGVVNADHDRSLEGAVARALDAHRSPGRGVLHGVRKKVREDAAGEAVVGE